VRFIEIFIIIISDRIAGLNKKREETLLRRDTFYLMNIAEKKYRLVK
jgi:hypothetical protein